ncbi:MAG: DUF4345 family protein [Deltaproteobacteria bacterium]|nr:DUF4345 family protein [Deltaproteobacteria bacterium]
MRLTLRRMALAGSGLTFFAIAIAALAAPRVVAAQYHVALDGPVNFNEFRAVFSGFWLGLAGTMLLAARRPQERLLGDCCGLMIGFQATARLVSFALDGVPDVKFVGVAVLELVSAALILAGRSAT